MAGLNPPCPQTHEIILAASPEDMFRQGLTFFQSGNLPEAEKAFRRLAKLMPSHPAVLAIFGTILSAMGRFEEAEQQLSASLKIDPSAHTALYNHGLALKALGRAQDALARFSQALAINPNDADALNNRGTVFSDLRDYPSALADFDKAIALNPSHVMALCNKGNALTALMRYDDAVACYRQALKVQPNLADGWFSLGHALNRMKKHDEAATAFENVLRLKPDTPFIKGILMHQRMLLCDWNGIDQLIAEIESDIAAGKPSAEPFGWQGVARTNQSLQKCAELYNARKFPAIRTPLPQPDNGAKIRIGYLAGEFRAQATSMLLVGVLEQHDKNDFEIYAFDNGWDDGSDIRKRIDATVHRIVPIRALNDAQTAQAVREYGIDILVNLNGYFGEDRTHVFARRPAPVQVNYLGFPGTLGAAYMDYIVADEIVIPQDQRAYFTEKVVTLPDSYQCNDSQRYEPGDGISRAALGLPDDAVVFCCFNNTYKITPETFGGWMRILSRVPNSVLWLLEDHTLASENLRREAKARGIDPSRLIFAGRMAMREHLARHRCADLFLDTLPYNAHTTPSDALWAGLPLLTYPGEAFASRVAASLLKAMDLPELIAASQEDYENLAVALASDPARLKALREKVASNRTTTALYDTPKYTRYLEQAYREMHARRRKGQKPDHITIAR